MVVEMVLHWGAIEGCGRSEPQILQFEKKIITACITPGPTTQIRITGLIY